MPDYLNTLAPRVQTQAQRTAALLKANQRKVFNHEFLVDGLFEGGGALGAAYVGGLRALEDNNFWFARVAGNSAGAITAAMIAVGFTAQEIQWLSSAFPEAGRAPQTLLDKGIDSPIPFSDFLDLPTINSISQSEKRRTVLWHILKGTLIDVISEEEISFIPTEQQAVDHFWRSIQNSPGGRVADIMGFERPINTALHAALGFLPANKFKYKDFLPETETLRIQFADRLWDEIAKRDPLYLISTNLWHEGSIFEGDKFLTILQELFGKKVHNNPSSKVIFNDLPIPLAVIATDIDAGSMMVYSKQTKRGRMEVAEAVRQSMSIPFIFEPRGSNKQFVDGGLCSNFPLWLFKAGGNRYWDNNVIDHSRAKIGFSLNESIPAEPSWQTDSPRFTPTGNPLKVNDMQVLKPIFFKKMVEVLIGYNVPRNLAEVSVRFALNMEGNRQTNNSNVNIGLELIEQIAGVVKVMSKTEDITRQVIKDGLADGIPYIDVEIPLLEYHGLDFYINEDGDALLAMWDRAWRKTIEGLQSAASNGGLGNVRTISERNSPFNWR